MSVLIIDDNRGVREHLELLLSRYGVLTYSSETTEEGFSFLAHSSDPVVVLLRADLSEHRSYALCELIRNTDIPFQPYIIGYADRLNRADIKQLLESGIDDTHEGLSDPSLLFLRVQNAQRHIAAQVRAANQINRLNDRASELIETLGHTSVSLFEEDLLSGAVVEITHNQSDILPFPLDRAEQDRRVLTGIPSRIEEALNYLRHPVEYEVLDDRGQAVWVQQMTLSLSYEHSMPVRRVSLLRNISEQRLRERELRQKQAAVNKLERSLAEIVDAADIGIIEYNPAADQVRCNSNALNLLFASTDAKSEESAINLRALTSSLTKPCQEQLKQLFETAQYASTQVNEELRLESSSGKVNHLHFSLNTRFDDAVLISGAITNQTQHYSVLADRDIALEQSRALFDQLQIQNSERTRLFSIISHELRTPLASLQMLAEHEGLAESVNQGEKMTNLIEQSLQLLTDLRAVIDPSKPEGPRVATPHTLDTIIEQAVETVQPLLNFERFTLSCEFSPKTKDLYLIDQQTLRRSLINLVKNAALHSGGSHIDISVAVLEEKPDQGLNEQPDLATHRSRLKIDVKDNGQGIPADKIEELFLPYQRGATERDGSGLGLMIVKQLIESIGGRVHYISGTGGAHFVLEAPLIPASEFSAESDNNTPLSLTGTRVLYAEDNPTLSLLTQKLLSDLEPRELFVAENGATALDAFIRANGKFDLVITDIFMPQLSGYDLTTELRHRGFRGKIIALTAATLGEETDRIINLGADLVIEKPLTRAKLQMLLQH